MPEHKIRRKHKQYTMSLFVSASANILHQPKITAVNHLLLAHTQTACILTYYCCNINMYGDIHCTDKLPNIKVLRYNKCSTEGGGWRSFSCFLYDKLIPWHHHHHHHHFTAFTTLFLSGHHHTHMAKYHTNICYSRLFYSPFFNGMLVWFLLVFTFVVLNVIIFRAVEVKK